MDSSNCNWPNVQHSRNSPIRLLIKKDHSTLKIELIRELIKRDLTHTFRKCRQIIIIKQHGMRNQVVRGCLGLIYMPSCFH